MRTGKEKMLAGELYNASAPKSRQSWLQHTAGSRYNAALDMAASERHKLLLERFAAVGDGAVIRPPFHCDHGFTIRLDVLGCGSAASGDTTDPTTPSSFVQAGDLEIEFPVAATGLVVRLPFDSGPLINPGSTRCAP